MSCCNKINLLGEHSTFCNKTRHLIGIISGIYEPFLTSLYDTYPHLVFLGNDFWRSGLNQCQSNGIWGLLPPDNFFPFNIPLAPLMANEEGGGVAQYADIGGTIPSSVGMCLKQKACDVCRGVIVDCGRDRDSPNGDFNMSEEDSDSLVKRATLLVPLPPVYAEAVNKRRAAYETWQKTIKVIIS